MAGWTWEYEGYDPQEERLREALCTLGNGYFATRGAAPETSAGPVHYPGTYAAGCYNRLLSDVAGRQVENEDLVNLPNWLPLRFRVRGDAHALPWFTPDDGSLLAHRQVLDLRGGTLTRHLRVRVDGGPGRELRVVQKRLVHMGDPHVAALRTEFTAIGWSGALEIESALDGDVTNAGVNRYRDLAGSHLTRLHTGMIDPSTCWLRCRTVTSDVRIALAARTRVTVGGPAASHPLREPSRAGQWLTVDVTDGMPLVVEKTVALYTSRDPAISDPSLAALDNVQRAADFPGLLATHHAAWQRLWRRAELQVPGQAGDILRLHTFHLLQTLSPHTAELDVGVPARGLHGEAYRGHVFWDELFVLPYLNLHFPEVSRALLDYRYRRLPQACRAAVAAGRAGAMYPWQSGSDGREETQVLHLNPRSGRWLPDHSRLQHHVGSAVAYNVWRYCEAAGDTAYLHTRGAEMVLQVARFWSSAATYDPALDRYRIRGVVGPDEYHDGYPGAAYPGLNDNAYTNVTAAWVLARGVELTQLLPTPRRRELLEQLEIDAGELDRWREISRRLHVPFHADVVSQFEGYGDLAEIDWAAYRARYGDIRRLDRILEDENDTPNRYQISKQADVLMLGYLFSPAELTALFQQLGHIMNEDLWRSTVDYYLRRTAHGSTLSSLVHGWVLTRAGRQDAWEHCLETLKGDVADTQGGTTAEGIHLGAMAGTLDLVQRGLTGLETREDALRFDPAPLPELSDFGYRLRYRGHWDIGVRVGGGRLLVTVPVSEQRPVPVVCAGQSMKVSPGETRECVLDVPSGDCSAP
ncbi:glycoside hydrolase family 65 protein [Streptomyces sp. NPDC053560]|uniref:glycoside hydrolase family 65 protein n=1 Tax=Streptomyces sp. NPDC053560 TaxID=3365711 RepID=UPI0037D20236